MPRATFILALSLGAVTLPACAAAAPAPVSDAPAPITAADVPERPAATTMTADSAEIPPPLPDPPGPKKLITSSDIRKIVNGRFTEMAKCYQAGLERDPSMRGAINVLLAIAGDGSVAGANLSKTARAKPGEAPIITDKAVTDCVLAEFRRLRFPKTHKGIVNLIYPIEFSVE